MAIRVAKCLVFFEMLVSVVSNSSINPETGRPYTLFERYFFGSLGHSDHAAWEIASQDTILLVDRLLRALPGLNEETRSQVEGIKECAPTEAQAKGLQRTIEERAQSLEWLTEPFRPFMSNYRLWKIFSMDERG